MGLKDPIVAGVNLIRSAIQSVPFVSGLLGWRIARDGTAEFNDITARGNIIGRELLTNGAGLPYMHLYTVPAGVEADEGFNYIEFFSNAADEDEPFTIIAYGDDAGSLTPRYSIRSADLGGQLLVFTMTASRPLSPQPAGGFSFHGVDEGGDTTALLLDTCSLILGDPVDLDGKSIVINNPNDLSPTSTNHGFQIGTYSDLNLGIDTNEVMARDNGAAATLNLQNSGGLLQIGAPVLCGDMRALDEGAAGNVVTTSATFAPDNANGPNFTFAYPPSGRVLVLFSADAVNSGAGFSNMTIRIRNTNAAGAIQFTGGSEETARKEGTGRVTISSFAVVTGLPTSGTGFVEGLYLASSGTATFRNPDITVVPVT